LETAESAAAITSRAPDRGRRRWRLRPRPAKRSLAHSGLPDLVALLLELRGISTLSQAQVFLGGRALPRRSLLDMAGVAEAVDRLQRAIRDQEVVTVYGDFDVDGITSTATLTEAINDLGGCARPYIPNRQREGYGLNVAAVEALAARGTRVLVTCDCGTTNVDEVARARELHVDVIVVDHHAPPARLPAANALINPKLPSSNYPFRDFATAGLAFRLAEELYDACGRPFPDQRYLDLAALGTVADLVPLVDENRDLVRRGLAAIASTERPGVLALVEAAGLQPQDVTSQAVAYALAPRLNAAGRLDDAGIALELLMTDDEGRARDLAARVDDLNRLRQEMTREAERMAHELSSGSADLPLSFVGHAGFHQGIVGLVASRLVEVWGRPAVVFQVGDTHSRGSCRSIPEYDIVSGLRACGDLFERYGGHRQAGGFTIANSNLPALEERLIEHARAALRDVDLGPVLHIDTEWELGSVRGREIQWLAKLEPHGMGNEAPALLSRGVTILDAWSVGDEGRHIRLKLKDGPVTWAGILFGWEAPPPPPGSRADIVFTFGADRYGPTYAGAGNPMQLTLLDMAVVE
jgi:single-stranded-DNA-specific exonuclease